MKRGGDMKDRLEFSLFPPHITSTKPNTTRCSSKKITNIENLQPFTRMISDESPSFYPAGVLWPPAQYIFSITDEDHHR